MSLTPKQLAAQKRNWLILRLRGSAALMRELGSEKGLEVIDEELKKLNAKTDEQQRQAYKARLTQWTPPLKPGMGL